MDLNTIALVFIALLNVFTGWMTWRARAEIKVVEKHTNSMKDALVAATDKAARAEGMEAGRQEEAERAK